MVDAERTTGDRGRTALATYNLDLGRRLARRVFSRACPMAAESLISRNVNKEKKSKLHLLILNKGSSTGSVHNNNSFTAQDFPT